MAPLTAPALLIIDVQQAFASPTASERNNLGAEDNIARLLAQWRVFSHPVVHVKHDSVEAGSTLRPGSPGNAIQAGVEPLENEPVFSKTVNSAFIGTDLEQWLRKRSIQKLLITGLTTDHCVSTSVRMAANLGFDVQLVSDATATFERYGPDGKHYSAEQMHEVNIASLSAEFCTVVVTDKVLATIRAS